MALRRATYRLGVATKPVAPAYLVPIPADLFGPTKPIRGGDSHANSPLPRDTLRDEPSRKKRLFVSTPSQEEKVNSSAHQNSPNHQMASVVPGTPTISAAISAPLPSAPSGLIQRHPITLHPKGTSHDRRPRSPEGWLRTNGKSELERYATEKNFTSNVWVSLEHVQKIGVAVVPGAQGVLVERRHPQKREERLFNAEETTDPNAVVEFTRRHHKNVLKVLEAKSLLAKGTSFLVPLTAFGGPHAKLGQVLMRRQAQRRGFQSRYWVTQKQAAHRGADILPSELPDAIEVMVGGRDQTMVVRFYNAEQTTHPELFTEGTCTPDHLYRSVPERKKLESIEEIRTHLLPMMRLDSESYVARLRQEATLLSQVAGGAFAPKLAPSTNDAGQDNAATGIVGNVVKLDTNKAGMGGVDKERVERIINEMTRGSKFYMNELQKAKKRQEKVQKFLEKNKEYAKLTKEESKVLHAVVEQLLADIRESYVPRGFIHIDMDMFYCAVEQLIDPTLVEVPFAVGSNAMLATSNYKAREFGVRAALPGYIAKKLCPDLVIVPPNMERYKAVSDEVREIVARYDPHFLSGGLDEMTLCADDYIARNGGPASLTPADVAARIRSEIFTKTKLTSSAGIAATPVLSKMVAGKNKPNGQFLLKAKSLAELKAYLSDIPVRKVPGIGPATEELLLGLGIPTLGRLYDERHRLAFLLTPKTFEFLLASSLGVSNFYAFPHLNSASNSNQQGGGNGTSAVLGSGDAVQHVEDDRKSLGISRTFTPFSTLAAFKEYISGLLADVYGQLTAEGYTAGGIQLSIKYTSFKFVTTHRLFPLKIRNEPKDLPTVRALLDELLGKHYTDNAADPESHKNLRLVGVSFTKLHRLGDSSDSASKEGDAKKDLSVVNLPKPVPAHAGKKTAGGEGNKALKKEAKAPTKFKRSVAATTKAATTPVVVTVKNSNIVLHAKGRMKKALLKAVAKDHSTTTATSKSHTAVVAAKGKAKGTSVLSKLLALPVPDI